MTALERLDRWIAPQQGECLRLGLRNLYILPTRFGCLWLCGAALLLLVAIQTQQNGPLLLGYLMLGLLLLALLLTHLNMQGLELTGAASAPGFAASPALYTIVLNSRQPRDGLRFRWLEGPSEPCDPLSIDTGSETLALPWTPTRRGWRHPGRMRLVSTAPLGLFRCWTIWEPPQAQLIYPQRQRGPCRMWATASDADRGQANPDPRVSGLDEWNDLQPHRPEEGPGRLAWKQLAQGRGRMSKTFLGDGGPILMLSPQPGIEREQALGHLCERVCELSRRNALFGLELPGQSIPPGQGPWHRDRCLAALALQP
jgi:uncharacterized protein (DUF58 family)